MHDRADGHGKGHIGAIVSVAELSAAIPPGREEALSPDQIKNYIFPRIPNFEPIVKAAAKEGGTK